MGCTKSKELNSNENPHQDDIFDLKLLKPRILMRSSKDKLRKSEVAGLFNQHYMQADLHVSLNPMTSTLLATSLSQS